MKLYRLLALVLIFSTSAEDVAAKTKRALEVVQPAVSERGTFLFTTAGTARIVSDGKRPRRLPVGRFDLMSAVAEIDAGWVVAGTRELAESGELQIFRRTSAGRHQLPPPQPRTGTLRLRPVLLVEGGYLAGMAWLEGDAMRQLTVRAAAWNGIAWDPAVTVSAPGPGSQTGLAGAILTDGSWLLTWSAWDGSDDELMWSRRRGENWSAPRRVGTNNQATDITPALLAAGDGAWMAWARLEGGEYRVMRAEFAAGRWTGQRLAGDPGSGFPSFARTDAGRFLVYRDATAGGWQVEELGRDGRARRRARVTATRQQRPAVEGSSSTAARVRLVPRRRPVVASWEAVR